MPYHIFQKLRLISLEKQLPHHQYYSDVRCAVFCSFWVIVLPRGHLSVTNNMALVQKPAHSSILKTVVLNAWLIFRECMTRHVPSSFIKDLLKCTVLTELFQVIHLFSLSTTVNIPK